MKTNDKFLSFKKYNAFSVNSETDVNTVVVEVKRTTI